MTKLEFREESHTYWLGERELPSVSSILAPVVSFDGINPEVLERKSAIGKATHLLCEWHDLKVAIDKSSIDDAVLPYFEAYKRFCREVKPKWALVEVCDHHRTHGYAGTLDRLGWINKEPWQIDLKTVAQVSPATGLQTAAYSGIYASSTANVPVKDNPLANHKRGALQLKPDGSYRLIEFKDPADWPTFLSLLTIFNWRKKHGL